MRWADAASRPAVAPRARTSRRSSSALISSWLTGAPSPFRRRKCRGFGIDEQLVEVGGSIEVRNHGAVACLDDQYRGGQPGAVRSFQLGERLEVGGNGRRLERVRRVEDARPVTRE